MVQESPKMYRFCRARIDIAVVDAFQTTAKPCRFSFRWLDVAALSCAAKAWTTRAIAAVAFENGMFVGEAIRCCISKRDSLTRRAWPPDRPGHASARLRRAAVPGRHTGRRPAG